MNINDKLVEDRVLFIYGRIDNELALNVNAKLLYLNSLNHEPITIYINSEGGSVLDGYAIIDTMDLIDSEVICVVNGLAASMGSLIAVCGDKRYITPLSRIMIHQPMTSSSGQQQDLEVAYQNISVLKKEIIQIYSTHSKLSKNELEDMLKKDCWLDATKSVEHGLCDQILCN